MADSDIKEEILLALGRVQDPELHRDLVSLNMVKDVRVDNGVADIHVELTTPACPLRSVIRDRVTTEVGAVAGVTRVNVEFSARVRQTAGPLVDALPGVKNLIAVGAGKGGVGKSTVAAAVAVGLAREGARVGVLDADVYGPSMPTIFGVAGQQPVAHDQKMLPIPWHSETGSVVKIISVGFLIPPDRALVWRGPMVHGMIRQFLGQVDWGELDYLIVDLPPGTGDVPLTLAQSVPLTGAVIVATPQELALADARRAVRLFRDVDVEVLGLVENMSYYVCPHCGKVDEIFSRGGGEKAAGQLNVPFLGAIPINSQLRQAGDEGRPEFIFQNPPTAEHVMAVVRKLAGRITVRNLLKPAPQAAGGDGHGQ